MKRTELTGAPKEAVEPSITVPLFLVAAPGGSRTMIWAATGQANATKSTTDNAAPVMVLG